MKKRNNGSIGNDDGVSPNTIPNTENESWQGPMGSVQQYAPPPPHHHGPHHGPHHRHPPHHSPHHHHFAGMLPRTGYAQGFAADVEETLSRAVESRAVNWILRAVSYGPPEMVSIFRAQLATMAHLVKTIDDREISFDPMSPENVKDGSATQQALSLILPANEISSCQYGLFVGPEEVQAIAFVELINLRLSQMIATADAAITDNSRK